MSVSELSLPVGLLAPILFAVGTSFGVALMYPPLRNRLRRLRPDRRATLVSTIALAPILAAVSLTLLAFAPSLLAALWPALDHCLQEAAAHPHLCIVHPPVADVSLAGWAVVASVAGGASVLLFRRLARLLAASQVMKRLLQASHTEAAFGAHVVDSAVPFAFTGGAIDARVFLSRALVDALSPAQLDIVVAHERCHREGRHPLWRAVVALGACLHAPWVRNAPVADFELATEQACDDVAAAAAGSRALVAKTILDVSRLARTRHAGAAAFGADHVTERVEALLSDSPWVQGCRLSPRAWAVLGLAAVVLSEPVHHLAETVLGLFV